MQSCVQSQGEERTSLEDWRRLQSWIEKSETAVAIPFSGWLADAMEDSVIRLRRDFRAVVNLIKAHAILHQESRDRLEDGGIIAAPEDYRAVYDLVADIVGKCNQGAVPERTRRVVLAVKRLEGREPVGYAELVDELRVDKSNVSKYVTEAIDLGFLLNEEKRKGWPARIRLLRDLPDENILPSPEGLETEWKSGPTRELVATAQHSS